MCVFYSFEIKKISSQRNIPLHSMKSWWHTVDKYLNPDNWTDWYKHQVASLVGVCADFRSFQIIRLIAFPKLQIFIFSSAQKELCDNTTATAQHRRDTLCGLSKQTWQRVLLCSWRMHRRKWRGSRLTAGYVRNIEFVIAVKLCYDKQIRSWLISSTDFLAREMRDVWFTVTQYRKRFQVYSKCCG